MLPAKGEAATLNGELIRAVNRLYHEYYNNGNCNAVDVETEYDEEYDEEIEGERSINPYYGKFLNLLETVFSMNLKEEVYSEGARIVESIRHFLHSENDNCVGYFSDKNMTMYDRLVDYTLLYVVNHEDRELPDDYERG